MAYKFESANPVACNLVLTLFVAAGFQVFAVNSSEDLSSILTLSNMAYVTFSLIFEGTYKAFEFIWFLPKRLKYFLINKKSKENDKKRKELEDTEKFIKECRYGD